MIKTLENHLILSSFSWSIQFIWPCSSTNKVQRNPTLLRVLYHNLMLTWTSKNSITLDTSRDLCFLLFLKDLYTTKGLIQLRKNQCQTSYLKSLRDSWKLLKSLSNLQATKIRLLKYHWRFKSKTILGNFTVIYKYWGIYKKTITIV